MLKELLRSHWETRPSSRRVRRIPPGINNRTGMLGWESDEPVVAAIRGNARGAKGLWRAYAEINEGRTD